MQCSNQPRVRLIAVKYAKGAGTGSISSVGRLSYSVGNLASPAISAVLMMMGSWAPWAACGALHVVILIAYPLVGISLLRDKDAFGTK